MNVPSLALAGQLRSGALSLGLSLTERQLGRLLNYLDMLQKWNRVYNLTSVREPESMLRQHLLDSLAVVAPLQKMLTERGLPLSARLLDVGSGGGLPGVVLAVACPDLQVTCVDAVSKKVAFVRQVAAELELSNLAALHARVERVSSRFDIVCSRAFAALPNFVQWTSTVLADGGCWMALKGQHPADEIARLPVEIRVFHVEQLSVPGLDAQRCLVWMEPGNQAVPA